MTDVEIPRTPLSDPAVLNDRSPRTLPEWLAREGRRLVSAPVGTVVDATLTFDAYVSLLNAGGVASEPGDLTNRRLFADWFDRDGLILTFPPDTFVPPAEPITAAEYQIVLSTNKLRLDVSGTPVPLDPDRNPVSIDSPATTRWRLTLSGKNPAVYELTCATWTDVVAAAAAECYEDPTDQERHDTWQWLTTGRFRGDTDPENHPFDGRMARVMFEAGSLVIEAMSRPVDTMPTGYVASPPPLQAITEPTRTITEWATLDQIDFVNHEGFPARPDLADALLTKQEYLSGKTGSLFKPAVRASSTETPKDVTVRQRQEGDATRIKVDGKGPTLVDGDTLRRLTEAVEEARALEGEIEGLQQETKDKRKKLEEVDKRIRTLATELRSPQPSLFDGAATPAPFNPNASVSDSPPAGESPAVPADGADSAAATKPDPIPDSAWRDVPVTDLGLSPGLTEKLNEKFGPDLPGGVATVGAIADYCKTGRLTDIKGVGQAASDKVSDALDRLWARLGVAVAAPSQAPAVSTDAPSELSKQQQDELDKLNVYVDQRLLFLNDARPIPAEQANAMRIAIVRIAVGSDLVGDDLTAYMHDLTVEGIGEIELTAKNGLNDPVYQAVLRHAGLAADEIVAAVRAELPLISERMTTAASDDSAADEPASAIA